MVPNKETQKKERNLLFIDIETVSKHSDFEQLDERMQKLWVHKASFLKNDLSVTDAEMYFKRAGIYAEFGKIVAIGMGFFHWEDDVRILKVKTIASDNELALLTEFKQIIEKKYRPQDLRLCAHNGKEFDYPYLCRRMLVNGVEIPQSLNLQNRKPWEIPHLDTLEMWKFGDKKHYTSLELMAAIFGISTSKSDISGEDVNTVYHIENNLERIQQYCSEDIIVLAQLYLKLQNETLVAEDNINRIS
jgi:uncharacterized protein YprB with RNaseH-like and TPR domain